MNTRPHSRPARRRHGALAVAIAGLMAFLFLFTGLTRLLHQHGPTTAPHAAAAQTAVVVSAPDAADTSDALSAVPVLPDESDCALCALAHLPTTPALDVTPALSLPASGDAPGYAERPVAFFAARFCDRSAARAPPAA